jgi:hypothetical protein
MGATASASRGAPDGPVVVAFDRAMERVRDGVATAHGITGVPGRISGCLYRSDGTKVALSERHGGHQGDMLVSQNAKRIERPGDIRVLPGRGLYLGHLMGQYGHFITETLSTFWCFESLEARNIDYVLFHPFVFGAGLSDYARFCLRRFGISPEQVRIVGDVPLGFEEMLVPERLLKLNHSADPRLRWVYHTLAASHSAQQCPARRVYLSRRGVTRRSFHRVVANEVRIEALFAQAGFEIVRPETLPFAEQLAIFGDTAILAGLSSSALHNSLFLAPGALVIELGDPRYRGSAAPTQVLCDTIAGVRSEFIPFGGHRFGPRATQIFDTDLLAEHLGTILANEDGAATRATVPRLRPTEALEICYRAARPWAGHLARRADDWVRRPASARASRSRAQRER